MGSDPNILFDPVPVLPPGPVKSEVTDKSPERTYFRITASDLESCTDIEGDYSLQYKKMFRISGDTLFCEQATGSALWGIRLDHSNSIIRLRPGRTIKHPFRSFTVYSLCGSFLMSNPNLNTAIHESLLELYVSIGPLIEDSEPPRDGFGTRTIGKVGAIASTTERLVCADYNESFGVDAPGFWPGRDGGTLMVRNADFSNTLYIGQRSVIALAAGFTGIWRLFPGETLITKLTGAIQHRYPHSIVPLINNQAVGLIAYTLAGQCVYDWCVTNPGSAESRSVDYRAEMRGMQ